MTIIESDISFDTLGLIKQYDNGIREERVMTVRNQRITPKATEKYLVVNGSDKTSQEISFFLTIDKYVGDNVIKKILRVLVKVPLVFNGHHSLLKLHFINRSEAGIEMKISKRFLFAEESVSEDNIQVSDVTNSFNFTDMKKEYSAYYSNVHEKISFVCLVFDTGMIDSVKFQNGRSNLINKFFYQTVNKFKDVFFSIMTIGRYTESFVKIDNKLISDNTTHIMGAIADIKQEFVGNVKCNPFKVLFSMFSDLKDFKATHNIDVDLSLNVVMITDGNILSDEITYGFGLMRDELKVNVFCVGDNNDKKSIKTICNCKDWSDFFLKSQLYCNENFILR